MLAVTFLLASLPASADPSPEEAIEGLKSLVEHVAEMERAKAENPVEITEPQQPVSMADICYITLPDGKIQLEHCTPKQNEKAVIGEPVVGDLRDALAQAPQEYKELNPISVLPCSLARTASLWEVTPTVVAMND